MVTNRAGTPLRAAAGQAEWRAIFTGHSECCQADLRAQQEDGQSSLKKQISPVLKLECLSNLGSLCAVRGAIHRLAETMGFPQPACRSITRAVDEAMTNILRHAYGGRPDQPIVLTCSHVRVELDGKPHLGLEIVLEDQGGPADPAKMRGRELEEIKPGGLGLRFIHESMDVVEFRRTADRNQLRLVKYTRPENSMPTT